MCGRYWVRVRTCSLNWRTTAFEISSSEFVSSLELLSTCSGDMAVPLALLVGSGRPSREASCPSVMADRSRSRLFCPPGAGYHGAVARPVGSGPGPSTAAGLGSLPWQADGLPRAACPALG